MLFASLQGYSYHPVWGLVKKTSDAQKSIANILEGKFSSLSDDVSVITLSDMVKRVEQVAKKSLFLRLWYWLFNVNDYALEVILLNCVRSCMDNAQNIEVDVKVKETLSKAEIPPYRLFNPEKGPVLQRLKSFVGGVLSEAHFSTSSLIHAVPTPRDNNHTSSTQQQEVVKRIEYNYQVRLLNQIGIGDVDIGQEISLSTICRAYKKKALLLHPDKHNNSEESKEQFVQLGKDFTSLKEWFAEDLRLDIDERISNLFKDFADIRRELEEIRKGQEEIKKDHILIAHGIRENEEDLEEIKKELAARGYYDELPSQDSRYSSNLIFFNEMRKNENIPPLQQSTALEESVFITQKETSLQASRRKSF